ncbi:hypothetical protein TYRP_001726, partial [Tyrophagus putrescentiae]
MENFLQNFWETPDEQKSNDNAHITSNDEGIVVANIMPNVASCPPIEALAIVQNEQVVVNNEEQAKQSAVNEEVDVLNLNSFFAEQSETVETESFEVPVDRGAILHSEYHQQIFESTFSDMNTSH